MIEDKTGLPPETHNSEQDDEDSQAQDVAEDAQNEDRHSPLDSKKVNAHLNESSAQDTIDEMRDMEQSGRIDMGAYRGEPNHDDNEDKYGGANRLDDLPSDGSGEKARAARGDSPS
jgi:hypothetical protein